MRGTSTAGSTISMAGRFDPVREAANSSQQRYGESADEEDGHPHSAIRPRTTHNDDFDHRDRRPSRSASIADILNPMPPMQRDSSLPETSSPEPIASDPILPEPAAILPEPVKTPYRPNKRVSAATTIRTPVSPQQVDEMRHQCANSLRRKWQQAHPNQSDGWEVIVSKFAAQISQGTGDTLDKHSAQDKKRKREVEEESNARLVAHHYNSRQDQGLVARQNSPILPLRNFNNWIKSVIIGKFAKRDGRVLDLGGGKGGDLQKWDRARISEYILCDIASVSVEQARKRYNDRPLHFQADFYAFDCFGFPIADNIPRRVLEPQFDNVSLQFCLHYGWESVHKAQLMLENISRFLKRGGIFVGTIPNSDLLRSKLQAAMDSSPTSSSANHLKFGNEYYSVQFEEMTNAKTLFPPFGHKYSFTLLDAVDDVAEYVVDWEQLVALATQNKMRCIYKKTFEQIWREEGRQGLFQGLTRKMQLFANGPDEIPMKDENLWEATGESFFAQRYLNMMLTVLHSQVCTSPLLLKRSRRGQIALYFSMQDQYMNVLFLAQRRGGPVDVRQW